MCFGYADGTLPRVTPEEIRREIVAAEGRKAQVEKELELLRGLLELHLPQERSIIQRNMEVATLPKSKGAKIAENRSVHLTPSRLACIEAELSDPMIADFLKCGRSTVQAWHNGTRPPPRAFVDQLADAEALKKFFKRDMTPIPTSVWKRIKG